MIILKVFLIFVLTAMSAGLLFMLLYLILSIFDLEDEMLYILGWRFHTSAYEFGKPCLSFEQFVAFYKVAPEKWDIDLSEQVGYKKGVSIIWLGFNTYRDCFKYSRWQKKEKERLRAIEMNKTMREFLGMVRQDSIEYEKKAYERANAVYDEILKNLNGE